MRSSSESKKRNAQGQWIASSAWVLLCALTGSRWLIEGVAPETASTSLSQAAGCVMAAGVVALPMVFRRSRVSRITGWRRGRRSAVAAGVALSGAALASAMSDRYISGNNATLALCLVPVVIAVAASARGTASSESLTARLWPGLMGMAGLLLLLPEPRLSSGRLVAALCCMPLFTGVGAAFAAEVRAERNPGEDGVRELARWNVVALGTAGLAYVLVAVVHRGGTFSIGAAGLDGAGVLLSVIALRGLGPTRWSAQFLAVPLVTLLEGAMLLRPVLDVRSWAGLGLLAAGAAYLFAVGGEGEKVEARGRLDLA